MYYYCKKMILSHMKNAIITPMPWRAQQKNESLQLSTDG
jgi:hypothetical protein